MFVKVASEGDNLCWRCSWLNKCLICTGIISSKHLAPCLLFMYEHVNGGVVLEYKVFLVEIFHILILDAFDDSLNSDVCFCLI